MLSIYIQYNDNIYREQHQTLLNLLVTHFLSTAYYIYKLWTTSRKCNGKFSSTKTLQTLNVAKQY